ncbi:LysR family transcriptional regulator [Vibrio sp.]|uniref:LysR family transcriptional regulator n=1 Tax=Vibrio sp. TaxID=678 RepID=UPI003D0AA02E
MNLSRIDLNLLVSLDVLLTECNVTRAAQRLHLSQPAMSAQLARLRELFNDPLLVPLKHRRGMTPTSRALMLQSSLRSALKTLGAVVESELTFDPANDTRRFHVAFGDSAAALFCVPLIAALAESAGPGVQLACSISAPGQIAEQMEQGTFDLLVESFREIPAGLISTVLREAPFVMVQRKGHPRGNKPLDIDSYCQLHHVVVPPEHGRFQGYMDDYLRAMNRERNIAIAVPQAAMVRDILLTTDYVCTVPDMLLNQAEDALERFSLPFDNDPYRLSLAWHPRLNLDPSVRWLRDQITALV